MRYRLSKPDSHVKSGMVSDLILLNVDTGGHVCHFYRAAVIAELATNKESMLSKKTHINVIPQNFLLDMLIGTITPIYLKFQWSGFCLPSSTILLVCCVVCLLEVVLQVLLNFNLDPLI